MVERLKTRWWASLRRVKAKSSNVQEESGVGWSSVLLRANVSTRSRSSGGKAPGSSGAGGVLQAGGPLGREAFTPQADGVAVAVQLVRDLLVGGSILVGGAQDEATTEDEGLRGRACADEGLELAAHGVSEREA